MGVIGVGRWGRNIVRVITSSNLMKLIAICDLDIARARSVAQEFGVEYIFSNYRDLLRSQIIDAIAVAVPIPLLGKISMEICRAGYHVFVEKPGAYRVQEAKELMKYEEKGLVIQPGYIVRFKNIIEKLRNTIMKESIETIHIRRLSRRPPHIKTTHLIYDLTPHDIDLAHYLLSEELELEKAHIVSIHGDNIINLILKSSSGIPIILITDEVSPVKIREIDAILKSRFIRADCVSDELCEYAIGKYVCSKVPDTIEPLKAELEAFAMRIQGKHIEKAPTARDILLVLEIIEKALKMTGHPAPP